VQKRCLSLLHLLEYCGHRFLFLYSFRESFFSLLFSSFSSFSLADAGVFEIGVIRVFDMNAKEITLNGTFSTNTRSPGVILLHDPSRTDGILVGHLKDDGGDDQVLIPEKKKKERKKKGKQSKTNEKRKTKNEKRKTKNEKQKKNMQAGKNERKD